MSHEALAIIRLFRTPNFTVVVEALQEYELDLSWDDTGEVARKIDSGAYVAFCAHAYVQHHTLGVIADDYLGNCIYDDYESFAGRNDYFSDMVYTVCREAREHINNLKLPRMRRHDNA